MTEWLLRALQRIAFDPDCDAREVALDALHAAGFASIAALPVGLGHAPEEDMADRVVAVDEAMAATVSDGVVGRGLDDLANHDVLGAVEAGDGDFDPVADVELHHPIVAARPEISYATVRCGICGECTGCECSRGCAASTWLPEGRAICRGPWGHDGGHVWQLVRELRALLRTGLEVANELERVGAGAGSRPASPVAPDGPAESEYRMAQQHRVSLTAIQRIAFEDCDPREVALDALHFLGFASMRDYCPRCSEPLDVEANGCCGQCGWKPFMFEGDACAR